MGNGFFFWLGDVYLIFMGRLSAANVCNSHSALWRFSALKGLFGWFLVSQLHD